MIPTKANTGITPAQAECEAVETAIKSPDCSNTTTQIDAKRFERALDKFCLDLKTRFDRRFPGISYGGDIWDFKATKVVNGKKLGLQQVHNTRLIRIRPAAVASDLVHLHASFGRAARAVLAHGALLNDSKALDRLEAGLRLFKHISFAANGTADASREVGTLMLENLRQIETTMVDKVKSESLSAARQRNALNGLYAAVEILQSHGVVSRMNARMSLDARDELGRIALAQNASFRERKAAELEPSIAALSDAIVEMVDENPVLSILHKAVLCVMGLEMCAPSRINEILTLSIKDRLISSAAFDEAPHRDEVNPEQVGSDEALKLRRDLHRAHAEIGGTPDVVLTMKGSKGAQWGPKPILDFMTDLFNECFDRLVEYGKRSRMLVMHYEQNPKSIYLAPELEHLRGRALDKFQIGQIMLLNASASDDQSKNSSQYVMRRLTLAGKTFNRKSAPEVAFASSESRVLPDGRLEKIDKRTLYVRWEDVEAELLRRVHAALDSIRWVTRFVRYEGKLSNMLMLHDGVNQSPPYLPSALSGAEIRKRLKKGKVGLKRSSTTVFELLGITMPIRLDDGKGSHGARSRYKEVVAYVSPHDPRRWLTTLALRLAGPQLAKVVLNKWANRKDASQVDGYDYNDDEEKARRSAAPMPEGMKELESFSGALGEVFAPRPGLQREYGLKTQLLTSGTRTVEVTTLSEVRDAVEDRPVARAGGKVIILYPTRYGVCLHQHHERACTAFNGCGTACSEQTFVKGDLPSNEATMRESEHLHAIVVAQIRPLILAHTRGVAHDPASLEEHIMALIKPHMSVEDIATRLIEEFHEYKHLIKDASFRARLEDAHVFQGVSKLLVDPSVASGALIKYDNPTRHGSPELERSIESLGGRNGIAKSIEDFNRSNPWFAPLPMSSDEIGRLMRVDEGAANDEVLLDKDDSDEEEAQGN